MGATSIEWTDFSVNPLRARLGAGSGHYCEKVSPGCKNCYSSRLQPRFRMPQRIPRLIETPAAVRFLSVEPLLGPVNVADISTSAGILKPLVGLNWRPSTNPAVIGLVPDSTPKISWVIVGSESGQRARPMDEEWVRSLRDQCAAAGTSFFYKQKLEGKKKVGLPLLDGRQWAEFPEVQA